MKLNIIGVLVSALFAFALIVSCREDESSNGESYARIYCSSCHLYPEPELLDRNTWDRYVLPLMSKNFGLIRLENGEYTAESVKNIRIDLAIWNSIVGYYLDQARPTSSEDTLARGMAVGQLTGFKVIEPPSTVITPSITLTSIDSSEHRIYYGDAQNGNTYVLNNLTTLPDSFYSGEGVVSLKKGRDGFDQILMGVLYPSDARRGRLVRTGFGRVPAVLIDSLQRPVHISYGDLNSDGLEDYVICEFGNTVGKLAWYERQNDGSFRSHVLRAFPGAVRTQIKDMNNDGLPDIVALMAQGDESIWIWYNQGAARFRGEQVIRFPPSYGSNYFELGDFDRNGSTDIVITNGDNGDYPPVLKKYHGIRIFLNDGHNKFTLSTFLPMHGVVKAMFSDFDLDGDLDIASIAFFPDFSNPDAGSFVLWKNDGQFHFKPYTFPNAAKGRWLTMDVGDMDGDHDPDIVIGNANIWLSGVPPSLEKKWKEHSSPVIVLQNRVH